VREWKCYKFEEEKIEKKVMKQIKQLKWQPKHLIKLFDR